MIAAHHRRDLAHHALVHGRLGEGQPAEVVRLDERQRGTAVSACMRTPSGPPVSTAIAPIQVGAALAADRLGAVALDEQRLRRRPRAAAARPAASLALLGEHVARLERRAARRPATHSASCVVVEVVEQVDRPQVGERDGAALMRRPGTGGSSETAIEPSPTALATRLIERARTSPATNTPGTLVSSR